MILLPALAPALVLAAAIDSSPAAARATVQRYYAAIDRGALRTAYLLWFDRGSASGKTFEQVAAGFARTARSRVAAGAARDEEGAAGTIYITVPVRVTATLKNGARQSFAGSYVLRRTNGVSGATPEELRWSIYSAKLRAVG